MNPHERGPFAPPPAADRLAPPSRPRTPPPGLSLPSTGRVSTGAAGLLALALALAATLLPGAFLGCAGGTSTDAGNPELIIGFRKDGKPVDFGGIVRIYAADSNPAFYSPSPVTGRSTNDVGIWVDFDVYGTNSYSWLTASPVKRLSRRFLDEAAGYRATLPLLPMHLRGQYAALTSAQPGEKGLAIHRPFNLLVDRDDSTTALVEGISIDALRKGYLAADGSPFDTLWVDLQRGVGISGTIDTAGLPDKPLILFMPGSPLSTPVQGNRFHLADAPRIKFPVRMVTRSGLIYAFKEPLDGTRSDAFYAADSGLALVPGDRQDSLDLPDVLPFPAAPEAQPAGPKTFTDTLLVTLTAEAGAVIHYSTDGEEPGLLSHRYTGPVRLRATATLKAVAYRQGQNLSPVSANNYVLVPLSPKAAPASQAFRDSVVVTLTTPAMDGVILYTVDGSEPHPSSQIYDRPLVFKATTTMKAVTLVEGLGLSQPIEERYILIPDTLGQP